MSRTEIRIQNVGYTLAADWYETSKDRVMLVLPGYKATKQKYEGLVSALVERTGYSALVLDYSGHGESPFDINDLSRADNFSDSVAAFDWLVDNYGDKKITVIGSSYGGLHAALLTKYRSFDQVVFRVPGAYPEESFYTKIRGIKDLHAKEYRSNPENFVNNWLFTNADNVKKRALVVTHEFDTVCPPVATTPFVNAFNADTWEAPGFIHGFGESDVSEQQLQDYYKHIADWINNES